MSKEQDSDAVASRLLLDIKALTILHPSDGELKEVLARSFVDYADDDVRRITDTIRPSRRTNRSASILVASAEIVLASFLAIIGVGSFASNVIGFRSPQELASYFVSRLAPSFGSSPLATAASSIDLAFSAILILGALYILRMASVEVKQTLIGGEASGKGGNLV